VKCLMRIFREMVSLQTHDYKCAFYTHAQDSARGIDRRASSYEDYGTQSCGILIENIQALLCSEHPNRRRSSGLVRGVVDGKLAGKYWMQVAPM